jgi:hypothetical protein
MTVDPCLVGGVTPSPNVSWFGTLATANPLTKKLTGEGGWTNLLIFGEDEVWELVVGEYGIMWYEIDDEYRLQGSYDEDDLSKALGEKFTHTMRVRRKADEEYARQQRYEQYLDMREEFDPEFRAKRQAEREAREAARKQSLEMWPDLRKFGE